jgi:hypothetical protein
MAYCAIASYDFLDVKLHHPNGLADPRDASGRLVISIHDSCIPATPGCRLHHGTPADSVSPRPLPVWHRLAVSSPEISLISYNERPYTVVAQAQVTSLLNGGLKDVYRKVNSDPDVSADPSDLLGQWQSTRNPLELDYPWNLSAADKSRALYNMAFCTDSQLPCQPTLGTSRTWSLSIPLLGTTWTLFSVDTSAYRNTTRHMESYQCVLNDIFGSLQPVQKAINAQKTLADWKQLFQSSVYNGLRIPASNNTGGILKQTLNSMTMIAWGNDYLLNSDHSTQTQGCITRRTHVLRELILLSGLTLALVVFLLLYWLVLSIYLAVIHRRMKADGSAAPRWIEGNPPIGIFRLMAQAVDDSLRPRAFAVKRKDPKHWALGMSASGRGLGIFKREMTSSPLEEALPVQARTNS